nr:immunoglobulin heavy chain junction region [Macaca mulatta]
CIKGVIYW